LTLVGILLLTGAKAAFSQGVVDPEPQSISTTLQQAGIPQNRDASSTSANSNRQISDSPFQWGSLNLAPHFLYRFLYGDGIQAAPGHPLVTAIDSISPGFILEESNVWTLDYTPTWNLYSNHAFRDTLDQSVNLLARKAYEDWTAQFVQGYSYSAEPLIETGSQTSERNYTSTLDVTNRLSDRVLVDIDLNQDLQYAVGFPDNLTWSNQDWLHFRPAPELDTAVGSGLGYVVESEGSDSAYVRPEAQFIWSPTNKISMSLTAGLEHREYYGRSSPSLNSPIYNVSLEYTPVEATKVTFTGSRQISPSLFEDQSNRSTQWTAGIEQGLIQHLHLSASIEYSTVDYIATNEALASIRNDEILSYNARLSTTLLRRGTIAILLQRSHDLSTIASFRYSSSQIGMELSYRY